MYRASIAAMMSCLALAGACTSFGAGEGERVGESDPERDGGAGETSAEPSPRTEDDAAATDAGGLGPCNGFPLCDDFEREDPAGAFGWKPLPDIGSVAKIETGPSLSPQRSFVVRVPGPVSAQGFLSKTLAQTVRRVRLAFGMRVAPTTMATTQLASVKLPLSRYIFVHADDTALQLVEQDTLTTPQTVARANAGDVGDEGWSRYVLDVDLTQKTAALSRDGKETARITLLRAHTHMEEVRIGATYSANGPARTLYYDDVGLLTEP